MSMAGDMFQKCKETIRSHGTEDERNAVKHDNVFRFVAGEANDTVFVSAPLTSGGEFGNALAFITFELSTCVLPWAISCNR